MARHRPGCPCGLPATYDACCRRFHRGQATPPTPELLMRSRYTAFVIGDAAYLLSTWHPTTRPSRLDLDAMPAWWGLEVLEATGGLLDTTGTVRFRAHYDSGVVEERSRFVRDAGRWSYLAAE